MNCEYLTLHVMRNHGMVRIYRTIGVDMDVIQTDGLVENVLRSTISELESRFGGDVLCLTAPMMFGVDGIVRSEIENLREDSDKRAEQAQLAFENGEEEAEPFINPARKLIVVLETNGGSIEVVERLVDVFRRNYDEVEFVIPDHAYSAGTVLAMSGDEIYMDYFSVLGPIDPQFDNGDGQMVPGMGYIQKYKELLETINKEGVDGAPAEALYLVKRFDPAKIFHIEQAIEHSKDLIKDWLPKYKFKNWEVTKTRGIAVDEAYKLARAEKIAKVLGDAEHWHSHGRGITIDVLKSDDIGLGVVDFGANPDLNGNIRHYFGLFSDYLQKSGINGATHSRLRLRRIF